MASSPRTIPPALLLLLVTLLIYLPGSLTLPLMDRDEPRFAQATVEMMARETWTVPYFNGEYRFDKPPLTYWWMRLHYLVGGVNELTARLHSVVAVWLIAWVITGIGTRLYAPRTGLMAGFVWLTMLQVMVHGRLCVADMPLVLFLTLMARALLELLWLQTPPRWGRWFWLLYGALGLAFLAKGPLALLVPMVALGLARWWGQKPLPWSRLQVLPGLAITLAIISAWGIPALIETKGLFWQVGMGEHVVKRGTEVLNGRLFIPGLYFVTAFISLFPWIGFIWPTWRYAQKYWNSGVVFLLAWLAAPYLIFSLYATQLPHYVMPGFPAAAVLIGRWLASLQIGVPQRTPSLVKWMCLVLGVIGLTLVVYPQLQPTEDLRGVVTSTGLLLIVLAAVGRYVQRIAQATRPRLGFSIALIAVGLSIEQLAWSIRQDNVTLKVERITRGFTADVRCLGWDYTEPSLVFYTKQPWEFTGRRERVEKFLREHPRAIITALDQEWTFDHWVKSTLKGEFTPTPSRERSAALAELLKNFPDLKVHTITGLNAARMSWIKVLLLEQFPPQVELNAVR